MYIIHGIYLNKKMQLVSFYGLCIMLGIQYIALKTTHQCNPNKTFMLCDPITGMWQLIVVSGAFNILLYTD